MLGIIVVVQRRTQTSGREAGLPWCVSYEILVSSIRHPASTQAFAIMGFRFRYASIFVFGTRLILLCHILPWFERSSFSRCFLYADSVAVFRLRWRSANCRKISSSLMARWVPLVFLLSDQVNNLNIFIKCIIIWPKKILAMTFWS